MPTDTELAYAAGIIDGEGSIHVAKRKAKNGTNYQPAVSVRMIDHEVPLWFYKTYGGHFKMTQRRKPWSPIYTWRVDCRKAASFLQEVLPYLRLKQKRAELAIQLAQMARGWGSPKQRQVYQKGHRGVLALSKEEMKQRETVALQIRAENQRSNKRISSTATWGIN